jgi:hypothetical protein
VKTGFYAPGEAAELGCGGVDGVALEGWLVCNSFDVGYKLVDGADLSEIDQLGEEEDVRLDEGAVRAQGQK